MKAIQIVTLAFYACAACTQTGFAQERALSDAPLPVKIVAPQYPALVNVKPKRTELVVIEVEVNAEGAVTGVKRVSGFPAMRGGAKRAALLWRFNASGQGGARSAQLWFVFHVLPKGSEEGRHGV